MFTNGHSKLGTAKKIKTSFMDGPLRKHLKDTTDFRTDDCIGEFIKQK